MSRDTSFTSRSLTASEYVRQLFEPRDNVAILVRIAPQATRSNEFPRPK